MSKKEKKTTSKKKGLRYRANVKPFVDSDYKDKLSDEDRDYLEQFENEYYANALNKEGSIHRSNLSEEEFALAKKETYDATNAQNRDLYAISATSSNYLKFIDDDNNYIEPVGEVNTINSLHDPQYAFETFLEATLDEINSEVGRDLESILLEFGKECVKLGVSLRRDKVSTSLRKQKEAKEKK